MGNPVVLAGVQIDVIATPEVKARYKHGMTDLNVFGYVSFSHDGYWEAPQYVNFNKMFISPRIPRPDFIVVRMKPDIKMNVNPIYEKFDALEILANNKQVNLLKGKADGLATLKPDGTSGSAPLITARP